MDKNNLQALKSKAPLIITIDGLASSGKSTVASKLAKKLAILHLNSGLLYRALAYLSLKEFGDSSYIDKDDIDEDALLSLLEKNKLEYFLKTEDTEILETVFFVNSENIENELRATDVSLLASQVSVYSRVREYLTDLQRKIVSDFSNKAVLEGRDAGTVVFPETKFKFYLDAPFKVRAKRRVLEVLARRGIKEKSPLAKDIIDEVSSGLLLRDEADKNRKIAPSLPAKDALIISTESKAPSQVVDEILKEILVISN